MFVGHFAVALGTKRVAPRIPLSYLVAAAIGLDLIWPLFLLTGIESVRIDPGNTAFTPLDFVHYPWSHSLVTSIAWGGLAAALAYRSLRSTRAAIIIGVVVVSHWVLDFVTHRPDLPLWPGGPLAGLGLWQSLPATYLVEGVMFGAAVYAYVKAFPPRDRRAAWPLVILVGLITSIWASSPFSAPPPSVQAIALVGLATWLFPPWAGWIERKGRRQ